MRVLVKICGITDRAALDAAADAGADAVGFVFAPSPRRIAPDVAVALAARLPGRVRTVAVFRHPTADEVAAVLARFRPDWIQSDAADLPALPRGARFLPVYRDGAGGPRTAASLGRRRPILFESATSGRGLRPDWDRARALAAEVPLVLAGGLAPGNVAEAIRRVGPVGVDVSSGVERAPGRKDPAAILDFVRAARAARRRG